MLQREEALRLIRSIVKFAGGALRETHAENDVILDVRLMPDPTPPRIPDPYIIPDPQRRYRVLNVDDIDRQNDLIYYYLRTKYEVQTARSAEEGLALAVTNDFDYVLMDLRLGNGRMSGFELTEALRKTERYSHAPIVAISGFNRKNDVEECIHAGCSAFLSKPFLKDDLLKMLHQLEPLVVENTSNGAQRNPV